MGRLAVSLVLLMGLLGDLRAQTPPVVHAIAITPDPATRLAPQQSLYVRVTYESDQPLRFQGSGCFQGRKHDLTMNASATYPSGKGEALVWVAGAPGARIDEVRIVVSDPNWKLLSEVPVKVQAEWHEGVPAAPIATWVKDLNEARQRAISQAMKEPPPPSSLLRKIWVALATGLVPLAFLSVPAYPLLQLYALWKLRGPARLLSALPLTFMLPTYAFSLYALSKDSNLWPLWTIFTSLPALILTLAVILIARKKQKTPGA